MNPTKIGFQLENIEMQTEVCGEKGKATCTFVASHPSTT